MSTPSPPVLLPEDSTIFPLATNSTIQFFWNAPTSDGGSPILAYQLYCSTPSITINTTSNVYTTTRGGLTNGTEYQFQIQASNANGLGAPAYFMSVEPGLEPGSPSTIGVSMINPTAALVQWTPPTNNGGANVKWYVITSQSTDSADPVIALGANGYDRSRVVDNLNSNSYYNFLIQSVNDPGYSSYTNFTSTTNNIVQNGLVFDFQPATYTGGGYIYDSSSNRYSFNIQYGQYFSNSYIYLNGNSYSGNPPGTMITGPYITLPSNIYSLTVWFQPQSTIGVDCALIGYNRSVAASRINIFYSASSNVYYGAVGIASQTYLNGTPVSMDLNKWNYMTVIYDGNNIITYLNNSNVGSSNVGYTNFNSDSFMISGNAGWSYLGPIGLLGEITLYNRVLTPFEIDWNYNNNNMGVNPVNLLIWLDMADTNSYTVNSGNISTISDKSGNGYILNQIPVNSINPGFTSILPVPGTPINNLSTVYFASNAGIKMSTQLNGVTDFFWVGRQYEQPPDNKAMLLGDDTYYDWAATETNYIWTVYAEPGIQNASATIFANGLSTTQLFVNTTVVAPSTLFMISAHGITGNTRFQGLCYDRDFNTGWIGDFGELICYNSNLSQKEINNVNSYLFKKWGFTQLAFTLDIVGTQANIYLPQLNSLAFIDWGDGTINFGSNTNFTHTYAYSSNYTIRHYTQIERTNTQAYFGWFGQSNCSATNLVFEPGVLYNQIYLAYFSSITTSTISHLPNTATVLLIQLMNTLDVSFEYLPNSIGNLTLANINSLNVSLSNLKPSIYQLNLQNTNLTSIPILPSTVTYLYVNQNPLLSNYTNITPGLLFLNIDSCSFTTFPSLPQTVEQVNASYNYFSNLDNVNNPYYVTVYLEQNYITQFLAESMATNLSGITAIRTGTIFIQNQQGGYLDLNSPPFVAARAQGWIFA